MVVDRKRRTADVTRIQFDANFSPIAFMAWKPGLGGYGAIFDGWLEREAEFGKRWPVLRAGDARLAEINSVTVTAKMTFEAIQQILRVSVRPIRLLLWTNIRPELQELDNIAGQTGYSAQHAFRQLVEDMSDVQEREGELREWFLRREQHHREKQELEEQARLLFEANAAAEAAAAENDDDDDDDDDDDGDSSSFSSDDGSEANNAGKDKKNKNKNKTQNLPATPAAAAGTKKKEEEKKKKKQPPASTPAAAKKKPSAATTPGGRPGAAQTVTAPGGGGGGGGGSGKTGAAAAADEEEEEEDEEDLEPAEIARRKEAARRERRLERKRQTPLEVDEENVQRLQGEIQRLIVRFSGGIFAQQQQMPAPPANGAGHSATLGVRCEA